MHQDVDDEGVLVIFRMPDEDEAETLRHYIGLRLTREVSPEAIQSVKKRRSEGCSDRNIDPNHGGAPTTALTPETAQGMIN